MFTKICAVKSDTLYQQATPLDIHRQLVREKSLKPF